MRKAALHNLGCKVNAYETEAMQQLLEEAGYEIVPFNQAADVYIINTCSVTNIADRKSRQMLHRAKKLNPSAVVVAAGCYVQSAGEELKKDGAVDLIIGNNKKAELPQMLEEYFSCGNGKMERVIEIGKTREYEKLSIRKIADHTRAFIKVQDGCNQFCSYCIIPYTRGRVRSRMPEEVWEEIRQLSQAGYQEVVLTGIHLSSYGLDLEEEKTGLLELIEGVHGIQGIERIRLGSLEPRIITEEFAKALSQLPKFCPHFHLSLQSGCDETLKRMNRRYTTEEYLEGCRILRKYFENPAITTDVIVGFPGETEEEFEITKKFLEKVHFYEMHVFKYSKREGTRAASMENQIPEQVKNVRSGVLLELEQKMSLEYRKSFIGKKETILLEEPFQWNGVTYMLGHTREYVKVAAPCGSDAKGTMITGVLTEMLNDEIVLCSVENEGRRK